MIHTPVSLTFQPTKLELHYEKSLKLQIVIFRFSEEVKGGKRAVKMDKTEPMKFTNPELPILFSQSLNLLTTIPFNPQRREYENKEVEFEMALQIDGRKERMARKLNLKDIIASRETKHKFEMDNPLLVLHYKVQAVIQEDRHSRVLQEKQLTEAKGSNKMIIEEEWPKSANKLRKEENIPKSTKLLKIEEQLPTPQQNPNGQKQDYPRRAEKGKLKTVNFGAANEDTSEVYTDKELAMRKSKSATRIQSPSSKSLHKNRTSIEQFDQSQKMDSVYKLPREDFEQRYNDLLTLHKQLSQKYSEKDAKVKEQETAIRELEGKLAAAEKWVRSAKEVVRQEQRLRSNCEAEVAKLKEEVDQYKDQIAKLTKNTNYQESAKHIFAGSEQQLKSARQKLRALQLKYSEQARETEQLEKQIAGKDAQIGELKSKTYALDRHNLELQSQLKNIEDKLSKERTEHEGDLRELTDEITEMKQQNRTLKKIPSAKAIKDDSGDTKKKLQTMEKQLQLKQQLLKKLSEGKKESENQNHALRKEIETLKETAGKVQKKGETCLPIEQKIQLEKMKKELEGCRKNEKTLLIEKNRLETANFSHQENIVRIKLSIANILNAVQETGNERLISEVYGFTE